MRKWTAVAVLGGCLLMAVSLSGLRLRAADAPATAPSANASAVVPLKDTPANRGDWGVMRPYFTGQTDGTRAVFVACGTIDPGKSIHGSHRHAEEEYLMITAGSGTWHLAGKDFPASKGDTLYVRPWVFHGIRNTGRQPLEFVVFKYASKGVPAPPRPDNGKDELEL